MSKVRIGLLGCGSIGGFLARHILTEGAADSIELGYGFDVDEKHLQEIPAACRITKQSDLFARPADLVVEAAHADLLKQVALHIVERSDLLLFSITALADEAFRTALETTAVKYGRKVFLPHGAMIGLDGLADAGATLKSVTVTTTKSPASLGLPPDSYKVVYEGPVREACAKFPRNVNVHAAISPQSGEEHCVAEQDAGTALSGSAAPRAGAVRVEDSEATAGRGLPAAGKSSTI